MMMSQSCLALAFAVFALAVPVSAEETPKALETPGVLLTFDDTHVAEWAKVIPLFKKYNAHATFFVTMFDQLTPAQIEDLKKLSEAGHSIGCHGLRHRKAAEHTKAHGLDDYLAQDITPALDSMRQAGFVPSSFAYPCSDNNEVTDKALLRTFRHLRTGAYPKEGQEGQEYAQMDVLFTPLADVAERGCLAGRSTDGIGEPGREGSLAQLFEAMDRAAKKRECLTLYAHNIADTGRLHLKPATLEKILIHGRELGLRFYSFDELP